MDRSVDPLFSGRRWLLKSTLALTAIGLGVGAGILNNRGLSNARLTANGRSVFGAFARGIFGTMMPTDAASRKQLMDQYLVHVDAWFFSLPAAKRQEISLMIGSLSTAPSRFLLTSQWASWDEASDDQVREALERLRSANSRAHNMIFVAARALSCIGFASMPEHNALLGYPGPNNI